MNTISEGDRPAPDWLSDIIDGVNVSEKYLIRLAADETGSGQTVVKVKWEIFYGCCGFDRNIFKGSFSNPVDASLAAAESIREHRDGPARANNLAWLMKRYHRL